jgi:protein ImuB
VQAQQSIFDHCAQHALAYTPAVYQTEPHTVLLEVEASLRLFGGLRKILYNIRKRTSTLHGPLSTSVAPTPTGAWLLTNARQVTFRYACSFASLKRALDPLSCLALTSAQEHRNWLDAIGCKTFKDLRALPRAGLARRIGPALLQELDAAYSQTHTSLKPYQPPSRFIERLDLTERIEHTVAITHALEHMLLQLCTWLIAKRSALTRLRIMLHHERYKDSAVLTQHDIVFAEPVHTFSSLALLVHEHLERLPLKDSVVALTV